ncbi:MAG: long-chain fatty acid--CoA ligase [Verrucomicrobia bacterium]|nr:long-chain fatty acid--CoA ligase [Verrucomicrobiota bacterium]MDE3098342.1 long-chain fatty acid--CoA ligase [Verrucomicrobiota bacterium]
MNLATAFSNCARTQSQKNAIFWGDNRRISYAELLEQSRRVAARLQNVSGVVPGSRVAVWLKNCPEFVPAVFGILMADAVVVPINNFLKPAEVAYILNDGGIDTVITDAALSVHQGELASARPSLKFLRVEDFDALQPSSFGPLPPSARCESDLAVIIYTSGTTGRPKGAMLSHGNLLHNVESCRIVLEAVPEDCLAVILPLFHTYMLTVGIFLPFIIGGSIVLVKSLHPPRAMLQELFSHRATILPAVPSFYRMLLSASIPSPLPVRIFISGSAPLPVQTLRDFEEKFKTPLIEGYGLSEASPVVSKNPLHGLRKPGSIGIPIPRVEMSVQNDQGTLLADNQTGEICVRGGNVMMGYWNQPEETRKALRNGWLLTGDVGHRDADGYYYITDRKKDMLLVNGINVYPREIEEIIYQFPGVKEAAVIGVPDARKGEQPAAYVSALEGQTLDQNALSQFIRSKLADYKVPRRIVFMPALPKNATGKILKTELRKQAAAGM